MQLLRSESESAACPGDGEEPTYGSEGGWAGPVVCLNLWRCVGVRGVCCRELGGFDDVIGGLALGRQGS